jgi:hypothetical protein
MEKISQFNLSEQTEIKNLSILETSTLLDKLKDWLQQEDTPEETDSRRAFIDAKISHLKQTYSDWQSYRSIYLLIGGRPPETAQQADFPAKDSIIEFINSL